MNDNEGPKIPITERLREAQQLREAYRAQISSILGYTRNEQRLLNELAEEEKKLKWQQDRVDRLRAMVGKDEDELCRPWFDKLEVVEDLLIHLRHEGKIELLRRMQATFDRLNADVTPEGRAEIERMRKQTKAGVTLAACDAEVPDDEE